MTEFMKEFSDKVHAVLNLDMLPSGEYNCKALKNVPSTSSTFESIKCGDFNKRKDKETVQLKSLTVSNKTSENIYGGIRAVLSDGTVFETEKYDLSDDDSYTMELEKFKLDEIHIQKKLPDKIGYIPQGWMMTTKDPSTQSIDMIAGIGKDLSLGSHTEFYTKLLPH